MAVRRLSILASIAAAVLLPHEAAAKFDACNQLPEEVFVAFGVGSAEQGWESWGWSAVPPQSCMTLLADALALREIYVYGQTQTQEFWGDDQAFCIAYGDSFQIYGNEDCSAQGGVSRRFERFEISGPDFTITFR